MRNLFVTARNGKGARVSHNPKTGAVRIAMFETPVEISDSQAAMTVLNHQLEIIASTPELAQMPVRVYVLDRVAIKTFEIRKNLKAGLSGEAVTAAVTRDWQSEDEKLEIDRLAGLLTGMNENVSFVKISDVSKMSNANQVGKQLKSLVAKAWELCPPPELSIETAATDTAAEIAF